MNSINKKPVPPDRSTAEKVFLTLSGLAFLCISPFIFIRLSTGDWQVAIVDTVISLTMVCFFSYVYITRKVDAVRLAMSIFFMAAILIDILIKGASLTYWLYPAIIVVFYLNSKKIALFICSCVIIILAILLYPQIKVDELATILISAITTTVFSFVIFSSYHKAQTKLKQMATTDELTSGLNRRALNNNLSILVAEHNRTEQPLSLLLLDLDKFKSINDTFGHLVGDQTLIRATKLLSENIRSYELLYRYGGEEFLIAPIKQNLYSAGKLAQRLRELMARSEFPSGRPLTVSIGVAQYQQDETVEQWISRADSALYQAKITGRNKVCLAKNK